MAQQHPPDLLSALSAHFALSDEPLAEMLIHDSAALPGAPGLATSSVGKAKPVPAAAAAGDTGDHKSTVQQQPQAKALQASEDFLAAVEAEAGTTLDSLLSMQLPGVESLGFLVLGHQFSLTNNGSGEAAEQQQQQGGRLATVEESARSAGPYLVPTPATQDTVSAGVFQSSPFIGSVTVGQGSDIPTPFSNCDLPMTHFRSGSIPATKRQAAQGPDGERLAKGARTTSPAMAPNPGAGAPASAAQPDASAAPPTAALAATAATPFAAATAAVPCAGAVPQEQQAGQQQAQLAQSQVGLPGMAQQPGQTGLPYHQQRVSSLQMLRDLAAQQQQQRQQVQPAGTPDPSLQPAISIDPFSEAYADANPQLPPPLPLAKPLSGAAQPLQQQHIPQLQQQQQVQLCGTAAQPAQLHGVPVQQPLPVQQQGTEGHSSFFFQPPQNLLQLVPSPPMVTASPACTSQAEDEIRVPRRLLQKLQVINSQQAKESVLLKAALKQLYKKYQRAKVELASMRHLVACLGLNVGGVGGAAQAASNGLGGSLAFAQHAPGTNASSMGPAVGATPSAAGAGAAGGTVGAGPGGGPGTAFAPMAANTGAVAGAAAASTGVGPLAAALGLPGGQQQTAQGQTALVRQHAMLQPSAWQQQRPGMPQVVIRGATWPAARVEHSSCPAFGAAAVQGGSTGLPSMGPTITSAGTFPGMPQQQGPMSGVHQSARPTAVPAQHQAQLQQFGVPFSPVP